MAGLRIVYSTAETGSYSPTLAMAYRGPDAIQKTMNIVGPDDHALARVTDPTSVSAIFGRTGQSSPIAACVHSYYWSGVELAKWFGGRACLETGTILGVTDTTTKTERRKRQRVRFSESESEDNLPPPEDIAYPPLISNRPGLMAYSYSKVILVASPHVPPTCYSCLLDACSKSGFDILGIKRLRLNSKRASSLDISPSHLSHYTPSSTPSSPALSLPMVSLSEALPVYFPPLPSLLFILGRENAPCHLNALIHHACGKLEDLAKLNSNVLDTSLLKTPFALLHATVYSDDHLKTIGSFVFAPTSSNSIRAPATCSVTEKILEEIAFVAIVGYQSIDHVIDLLNTLFNTAPSTTDHIGADSTELGSFELLGIKLIPELSRFQAKQLCADQHGTSGYHENLEYVTGKPSLLLVFRGLNVNDRISEVIRKSSGPSNVRFPHTMKSNSVISSSDLSRAFSLTSVFFIDKELFVDSYQWTLANYVPSTWIRDCSILSSFNAEQETLLSVFTVTSTHIK